MKIYRRHQAFNKAHADVGQHIDVQAGNFEVALKYHHAPEKLRDFKNYAGYLLWFNELYGVGQELIDSLHKLNLKINDVNPKWFEKKNQLNEINYELTNYAESLKDFYNDSSEFQRCILATGINNKHDYAEALFEQIRYLDVIESKINGTFTRKIYEMNSTRTQVIGIFLSALAVITSIISIYIAIHSNHS